MMNSRGNLIQLIASLATITLFFVPWVNLGFGIFDLGSLSGFDMAEEQPILFCVPMLGLICLGLTLASSTLSPYRKAISMVLIVLSLGAAIYLLVTVSSGAKMNLFGVIDITIGEAVWGLWLSIFSMLGISVGGFLNFMEG